MSGITTTAAWIGCESRCLGIMSLWTRGMENKRDRRESEGWSGMGPHDKFLELCAISTSGDLTEEEQKDLQAHLLKCPGCRQALKEFEAAAVIGMPLLHSHLSGRDSLEPNSIPTEASKATPAPATEPMGTAHGRREPIEQSTGLGFPHRNGRRPMSVNWNYVWMPFAAAVVLTVALGIYSFQVGKQKGQALVRVTPSAADTRVDALEQRISDAGHEREVVKAQLADRDRTIAGLRRQIVDQTAALNEMKSAQSDLEHSLQSAEAAKQQLAQEQSSDSQKLDVAQASLQKTQTE